MPELVVVVVVVEGADEDVEAVDPVLCDEEVGGADDVDVVVPDVDVETQDGGAEFAEEFFSRS